MKLTSVEVLYLEELRDLHSAEKQLVRALEKLGGSAHNERLKQAFQSHLDETRVHQQRLETIFAGLGESAGRKKCVAMEAIIEEGDEVANAEGEPHVKDAALIAAAQRAEHYEIAVYGC